MLSMSATCQLLTATSRSRERTTGLFNYYACSSYSSSCECEVYESEDVEDSSFKAARGCAGTAMGIGGIAMILGWVAGCVDFGRWYYILVGSIYALCVLFAGLSFLIFNTEYCGLTGVSCEPEGEIAIPIIAMLLWIVAAATIFIFPRRSSDHVAQMTSQDEVLKSVEMPNAQAPNVQGPAEVTTEEVLEDGTRVVKTVVYE